MAELWTPPDLAHPPALLFDWHSPITEISGRVSEWQDRSLNLVHMSNSTASARPAANISTPPRSIDFDANDFFGITNNNNLFQSVASAWVFVVARRDTADSTPTPRPVFAIGTGNNVFRIGIQFGDGRTGGANMLEVGGRRLDSESYNYAEAPAPIGEWAMVLGCINYGARTIDLYLDGNHVAGKTEAFTGAGVTSNTASQRIRMCRTTSDNNSYFNGSVRCAIAGVDLPGSEEIDRLFGWAAWECGLADNLPDGHPYKAGPPMLDGAEMVSTPSRFASGSVRNAGYNAVSGEPSQFSAPALRVEQQNRLKGRASEFASGPVSHEEGGTARLQSTPSRFSSSALSVRGHNALQGRASEFAAGQIRATSAVRLQSLASRFSAPALRVVQYNALRGLESLAKASPVSAHGYNRMAGKASDFASGPVHVRVPEPFWLHEVFISPLGVTDHARRFSVTADAPASVVHAS